MNNDLTPTHGVSVNEIKPIVYWASELMDLDLFLKQLETHFAIYGVHEEERADLSRLVLISLRTAMDNMKLARQINEGEK